MINKEISKITIAIYKGYKRFKVIKISVNLLRLLITVNSVFILSSIVLFFSFMYQWSINEDIIKKSELLSEELTVLRKGDKSEPVKFIPEPSFLDEEGKEEEQEEEKTERKKIQKSVVGKTVKVDEMVISKDEETNEIIIKFTLQNVSSEGDLISGYIVIIGKNPEYISSYPPVLKGLNNDNIIDYKMGEKFSIRVYRKVIARLPSLSTGKKYEEIYISIYSLEGDILENKVFRTNEYFR